MSLTRFLGNHRKGPKDVHTHTWFADGPLHNRTVTLHIGSDDLLEMRELLVQTASCKSGRASPNSVSEKILKNALFRLVVDLDFAPKDIHDWQERNDYCGDFFSANLAAKMRAIVLLYKDILKTVTGKDELEMILTTRLPYKIHLHFPRVVVNATSARRIVKLFVNAFQAKHPDLYRKEVVDESIYSTGLRLLYCHKGSMSNEHKLEAEILAHEKIFGKGSHCDTYCITDVNTWQRSEAANIADLERTSLHISDFEQETPLKFPDVPLSETTRKKKRSLVATCKTPVLEESMMTTATPCELSKVLSAGFSIPEGDLKWSGMIISDDGECCTLPTSCKQCPFAQREHNSNHLYVVLSPSKVILKCHDQHCTDCVNVETSTFSGSARLELEKLFNTTKREDAEVTENMRLQAVSASLDTICQEHPKMDVSHPSIFRTRLGGGDHWMCKLPENMWCPLHQREHDSASNCIIMTLREQQIICQLEPELLLELPLLSQYGNVIFGNQIINNNLNITVNGTAKIEPELAIDGIFDEIYPIFSDMELNRLMLESFNGFSYNIAKVVHHLGCDKMGLGENNEKDIWWVWNQTTLRWEKNSRLAGSFVSVRVAAKYIEAQHWFRTHTKDPKLRALRESKIDAIVKRLKDKDKRIILRDVAEVYNELGETSMDSKLDKDPYLLGFNKVNYDLRTGTRKTAESTDYVSMCVGYELPEEINYALRQRIIDTLHQIQPDEEEFQYLMLFLASTLDGRNAEEIFTIWTGAGRNGKGFLQELMLKTVGDYFKVLAATMLTNERPDSSKPIPDVLHLRNKRFAAASEPEEKKQINAGFVKWLTGNDPISGCFKHENEEVKFRGQHSLIMLCNKIPAINAEDKAFWQRARVQHFGLVFVDNPKPGTNERQVDRNLKLQIDSWAPQFMLLLLEYYRKYQESGLTPTPAIMKFTHMARNDNNPLIEFINDYYEKTDEESDRVKRKQVHDDLESWCKAGGYDRKELLRKKQQLQHQLKDLMATYGFELDEYVDSCGKVKAKMKRVVGEDGTHAAFSYIRHVAD